MSGHSPQLEAPSTAASSLGTLWDAADEAASMLRSLLAINRCRPLPSAYGLRRALQIQPPKPANHPWMLPERPWSRVHVDHAINFLRSNWLVLIDAYSKYPCIHPTTSTSTKSSTELWSKILLIFGYLHTIVSDNATSFSSEEFQAWCREMGITHLTGAPYHPATNGAAERLVQTFKQALCKSSLPPRAAL